MIGKVVRCKHVDSHSTLQGEYCMIYLLLIFNDFTDVMTNQEALHMGGQV